MSRSESRTLTLDMMTDCGTEEASLTKPRTKEVAKKSVLKASAQFDFSDAEQMSSVDDSDEPVQIEAQKSINPGAPQLVQSQRSSNVKQHSDQLVVGTSLKRPHAARVNMSDQLDIGSEFENEEGHEQTEIMVNDGSTSDKMSLASSIVTVCFECKFGKYANCRNSVDRCRGKVDSRFPRNKGHLDCNWHDDVRLDCRDGNRQQQPLTTSCMQKEVVYDAEDTSRKSKNPSGSLSLQDFDCANEENFKLLEQCEISDCFFLSDSNRLFPIRT